MGISYSHRSKTTTTQTQTQTVNDGHRLITREDVKQALGNNTEHQNMIIDDVLRIVNDGYRYPDRGLTAEYRIPEDISTRIALNHFGVNAYAQ